MGEEVFTQNRFQPLDHITTRLTKNEELKTIEDDKIETSRKRSPELIPLINTNVNVFISESSSINNFMYTVNSD